MSKVRFLSGGGSASAVHVGPCVAKRGYSTVANGYAAEIAPRAGEVAVQYTSGDAYSFARWIIGPPADVAAWLEKTGRHGLAKAVSDAALPEATPFAALANALGMGAEPALTKLEDAMKVAGVKVVEDKK